MRFLILSFIVLFFSGCAFSPAQEENHHTSKVHRSDEYSPARHKISQPHPTTVNSPAANQPIASPRSSDNSGVATLLQQASQSRMAGDLARAQALAERAQTLEPRQGHSYLELARIYQAKGDTARAKQMSLRGLSFAGDDAALTQSLQVFSAP